MRRRRKLNVVALDAATGRLLWRFDPNLECGRQAKCEVEASRTGRWEGAARPSLPFASISIPWTHKPESRSEISAMLRIDLRDNLGREPKNGLRMTSPGIVYKQLLIIGSSMAEDAAASPGNIRAYDVHSGN